MELSWFVQLNGTPKSRSRTSSQLSDTDGIDQSASNKTVALYNENKGSYSSRPSYTHRPQLAGKSSTISTHINIFIIRFVKCSTTEQRGSTSN